jgi:hypothetical protein
MDGSGFGPCDCGYTASPDASPGSDANESTLSNGVSDASADGNDATTGRARLPSLASEGGTTPAEAGAGVTTEPFDGEAPHAPLPQLVYQNGPVLTATRPVTVTFAGDGMAADLQSFGASVTSNPWWNTVTQGFCETSGPCVGGVAGTSAPVGVAAAPSYTDSVQGGTSSLQAWLAMALDQNLLPQPDPGAPSSTLYMLYFPSTTTITLSGLTSCDGFGGYHGAMSYGPAQVPYAVVMECDPLARGNINLPPLTVLQSTTLAASHELVESATDPVSTGYWLDPNDESNWGWMDVSGSGEVADLCVDFFGLDQDTTTEGTFTVQRMWNNARAAQGIDPCVPAPSGDDVYFNAAPERSFFVLDVGQSVTFEVDAFSSGPMAPWTLGVQDWSASTGPEAYLSFSMAGGRQTKDGPTIAVGNGSKVQVTATLLRDPGPLMYQEADGSLVSASFDSAGQPVAAHYFPFAVMSSTTAAARGVDAAGVDRQDRALARPRASRQPLHALPGN